MKINISQQHFSKLMRAVVEFDLIDNDDHILIGLSGGKDSLFLTYTMAILRQRLKKSFILEAITMNGMFDNPLDFAALGKFCQSLEIPYSVIDVDIAGAIKAQQEKSPCYTCAFFRRGAINSYAKQHSINKVAYAHHHDDAVETFVMNLFYSGQLGTFTPKSFLDRTGITVIRPLVYFREQEIIDAVPAYGLTPMKNPCPYDGKTTRQTVKELIAKLSQDNPALYDHLAAGMREGALNELWPRALNRDEMRDTYFKYMGK